MKKRQIGQHPIEVTEIGFGSLVMSFGQLDLPPEKGAEIVSYALTRGINLIDTAQFYQTYPHLRLALRSWNGPDPVICSKSLAPDGYGIYKAIEEARRSLDRDVIDVFFLHEVYGLDDLWYRRPALEALNEAKAKGKIRLTGISTHHSDVAEEAAASDGVDVLFPLVNVASMGIRRGDGFGTKEEIERAIATAAANGKGVFGMKAFGGGPLLPRYRECLDYALNIPGLTSEMIGFGSCEEVDRIFDYLDGTLPADYAPDMNRKELFIEETDCIGCGACVERCPNGALHLNADGFSEVDRRLCMTCGYCAPVCPMRAIIMLTKRQD